MYVCVYMYVYMYIDLKIDYTWLAWNTKYMGYTNTSTHTQCSPPPFGPPPPTHTHIERRQDAPRGQLVASGE